MITIRLNKSFEARYRQLRISRKAQQTANEACKILHWKYQNCKLTTYIGIDYSLRPGSSKVAHNKGVHHIRIHPRKGKAFPLNTIRHELLHSLLKSRVRSKLKFKKLSLPVPKDYQHQTFRENLEEYVVRCLNALYLKRANGETWYQKQIFHEVKNGFKLMIKVSEFLREWSQRKEPFSRKTFIELTNWIK